MATSSIMTTREFLNAVINLIDGDGQGTDTTAIRDKAYELISSLDRKNEQRKSADTKEKKEVAERREKVKAFFEEHPTLVFTRDEVANELEISPSQVSSACTVLVKDGVVTKTTVKDGKASHVAYTLSTQ